MALRISTGSRNMLAGINTDLVTNGTFATVTTGWTAAGATLSVASAALRVTASGAALGQAYQAITTKVGHVYKVVYSFKVGTAAAGKFLIGTTSAGGGTVHLDSGALSDATLTARTAFFIATTTTTYLVCESTDATAGEYSDFDTISCVCQSRSLQDQFKYGKVKFYTGTQPATPDLAPTGTMICEMKNGSAGITLDDAALGILAKPSAETWNGVCAATGTVGWGRICHIDDLETGNALEARVDFRVSTSGAEINFTSVAWDSASTQGVTNLPLTVPISA